MRCKICGDKFEPKYFLQKSCLNPPCILAWNKKAIEKKQKEDKKKWNRKKKKIKDSLKTKSDYLNELQKIFNQFIRLRDKGSVCISCQKPPKKENAGHYRSVGACPELRFEELNVHLQCEHCNTYLHGNAIEYRKNLINKIGLKKVEWIEKDHETKHYTVPELKEMKKYYRNKINKLKNN